MKGYTKQVQVNHSPIDIVIIDDKRAAIPQRLAWLSTAIDSISGYILYAGISPSKPQDTVNEVHRK